MNRNLGSDDDFVLRLTSGDYSIIGCEGSVELDRKILEDFVSIIMRGGKRFFTELWRLEDYEAACWLVEADIRIILGGRYRSGAHHCVVLGTVLSFVVDTREQEPYDLDINAWSSPTGQPTALWAMFKPRCPAAVIVVKAVTLIS